MSAVDIYPDGRIPSTIRLLALDRLHGGPNLATRKGFTRAEKREALLLVREWNPHQAFWEGERLILLGVQKDRDISGLDIKVPINIQTRRPRTHPK